MTASRWREDQQSKGCFEKPTIVGDVPTLQVYSLVLLSYLKLIVKSSTLNFADLLLTHVHFHPSITLHTDKLGHVTSDTRPFRLSAYACNIEKLGMGLGMRLNQQSSWVKAYLGWFYSSMAGYFC